MNNCNIDNSLIIATGYQQSTGICLQRSRAQPVFFLLISQLSLAFKKASK